MRMALHASFPTIYASDAWISYRPDPRKPSGGKPFASSLRSMEDAALAYWPHSSASPAGKRDDLDAFIERMELAGETRRLRRPAARQPAPRHKSDDATDSLPRIDLVLYTSAASEKSHKALRAVQEVLSEYVAGQVKFSTCDLSENPQEGEADSVIFTPTLVKQGPGPRTSIIGNLEQQEILKDLLDASGVDRRRWDD